jgi:hypothetical protein
VFGANSLAQVARDVACLAFVDGGRAAPSAVAVGGFQMENNLLLFDEDASRARVQWHPAVRHDHLRQLQLLDKLTTSPRMNFDRVLLLIVNLTVVRFE